MFITCPKNAKKGIPFTLILHCSKGQFYITEVVQSLLKESPVGSLAGDSLLTLVTKISTTFRKKHCKLIEL